MAVVCLLRDIGDTYMESVENRKLFTIVRLTLGDQLLPYTHRFLPSTV
jgi:hypothetical protein